jgi:hypothetical protein
LAKVAKPLVDDGNDIGRESDDLEGELVGGLELSGGELAGLFDVLPVSASDLGENLSAENEK